MDIFAAQLKRVTKVPIRKQRVRIDALNKGSASKGLTDDLDHLENHDQYFELPENDEQEQSPPKNNSSEEHSSGTDSAETVLTEKNTLEEKEYTDVQVIPEFLAYAKKPRIPREELKQLEDAKKSLKHFDVYI